MEQAPAPVSMKGALPLPQDRLSWLVASLLVGILLAAYYGLFYRQLEDADHHAYTFNEPQQASDNSSPVRLEVASPNSISSLSRQTIYLRVTNTTAATITVKVVPQLAVNGANSADYYVFHDIPDDSQTTLRQGGYLLFKDIPSQASVSQALTVQVLGLNQAGEGQEAVASTATTEQDGCPTDQRDETAAASTATTGQKGETEKLTVSLGFNIWQGNNCYDVKFANSPAMAVNSLRAVAQGIMSFLLLPPWANGFIPFLAIFLVYLFGIPEALRHCFPQPRVERTRRQKTVALAKLLGWLMIMVIVALLALWTLTQIAVVVLAGKNWSTLILPSLFLIGLALFAWGIDWRVIQLPVTLPPANGNRDTVTMTVNPAALNIQPPDGQPLTMAVNAATLTLQLNGDHPGDGGHRPAALPGEVPPPAAEPALVPVELPPPPARPKRTRKRKQPAPSEPAAPVEPAAPDGPATPSPQELLALMAQVREMEAQLAILQVSSAPPASDPPASPDAQVALPPEPDVPEQPTGVAPHEGAIFGPPPALPPAPDAAPDDRPPPDREPF